MSRAETPFPAVELVRPDRPAMHPALVLCDHASNALPARYGTLGLSPGSLERHIAYDIGARGVALSLARLLCVPAVLSCASRLLIDPNRALDDPTLVMRLSDGAVIPGNRHVADEERASRIAQYWTPYHATIEAEINRALVSGEAPILVSIHTFTPVWKGVPRPWHAGVLWDKDPRFAQVLIDGLRADGSLVVGDNEPYSGRLHGDCLYQHGTTRGIAHAIVEIRQDLVSDDGGQAAWAARLAAIIAAALADPARRADLTRIAHFGSHTDFGPV